MFHKLSLLPLLVFFASCSPSGHTSTPQTKDLGGTSSGGPPAILPFYAECSKDCEKTFLTIFGDTGYLGGSQPGEMPGMDGNADFAMGPDPCEAPWLKAKVHNIESELQVIGSQSPELDFDRQSFLTLNSKATINLDGQQIPLSCKVINAIRSQEPCGPGFTEVDLCPKQGWHICR